MTPHIPYLCTGPDLQSVPPSLSLGSSSTASPGAPVSSAAPQPQAQPFSKDEVAEEYASTTLNRLVNESVEVGGGSLIGGPRKAWLKGCRPCSSCTRLIPHLHVYVYTLQVMVGVAGGPEELPGTAGRAAAQAAAGAAQGPARRTAVSGTPAGVQAKGAEALLPEKSLDHSGESISEEDLGWVFLEGAGVWGGTCP